jgi:hypothetical protein
VGVPGLGQGGVRGMESENTEKAGVGRGN